MKIKKSDTFLALESLTDLSEKCSKVLGRSYGYDGHIAWNDAFEYLCWYGRVNIYDLKDRDYCRDNAVIEKLKVMCSDPAAPKMLTLHDEDVYEGFNEDLEAAGFVMVKPQKGMLYDLNKIRPEEDEQPDSEAEKHIIEVGPEDIDEFNVVTETAFEAKGKQEASKILNEYNDCHFYAYKDDGKIKATAILNICTPQNGGVHEVGTLQEYRNKGYATALMRHIIKESRKYGLDVISLQASVYGEPVYRRLGFEVVGNIRNYRFGA